MFIWFSLSRVYCVLLRADRQEGRGSITTLELKKDTAAHTSVPSKANGRPGETVKCLPCEHEDLSFRFQYSHEKLVVVMHSSNPSSSGAETGGSWDSPASQPSIMVSPRSQ